MKRATVGKSRSFNLHYKMRRSDSNCSGGGRRIVRSYDELSLPDPHFLDDSMSESDNEQQQPEGADEGGTYYEDWSQWASSIGLPPLLLIKNTASNKAPLPPSKSSRSGKSKSPPRRTRSAKFKPSYLLQRRKEALVQHTVPTLVVSMERVPAVARRNSIVALLILMVACYALMTLGGGTPPQQQSASEKPTLYYLNLKEKQPMVMIHKMLELHAFSYQQQLQNHIPSQFAGVCGYPTYQQESQRQVINMLVQLGLQDVLPWDVCPPLDRVLQRDPHYVMIEEESIPPNYFTPAWIAFVEAQTRPEAAYLWQKVLEEQTTTTTTTTSTVRPLKNPTPQIRGRRR